MAPRRARLLLFLALVVATVASACSSGSGRAARLSRPAPATTTTASPRGCSPLRPHPAGQTTERLTFAGVDRSYLLYVPKSYTGTADVPVVFDFHGYGSSAQEQIVYGEFRPLAERDDFLVVAPDGQGTSRHFNLAGATPEEADDVAFTLAILDRLSGEMCVDADRVFATGMSDGGAMSSTLACRAADRFAAVGPVAVVVFLPRCATAARPVPIAAFAGTADPVVPFDGGRVRCCGNPVLPGAPSTMAQFAVHDGCAAAAVERRLSPMVLLRQWPGCRDGTAVDFYIVEGGGHTWPGSPFDLSGLGYGVTTNEISASDTLWRFFRDHPLPGAARPQAG
jgi:polyhydroxybutyrate depolymerase